MATSAAPYGLKPLNRWGQTPATQGFRAISIASGYAANIYNGEAVQIVAAGTITIDDLTTPRPVGVFVGCTYTDPNLKYLLFKQFWPTGTVASDAMGYVVDDPFALFQVQANGTVAQSALGANVNVVNGSAGSTTTGNSTMAANATVNTTSTFPWRLVDFVVNPGSGSSIGDSFTDLIVSWNFGIHTYLNATGI